MVSALTPVRTPISSPTRFSARSALLQAQTVSPSSPLGQIIGFLNKIIGFLNKRIDTLPNPGVVVNGLVRDYAQTQPGIIEEVIQELKGIQTSQESQARQNQAKNLLLNFKLRGYQVD